MFPVWFKRKVGVPKHYISVVPQNARMIFFAENYMIRKKEPAIRNVMGKFSAILGSIKGCESDRRLGEMNWTETRNKQRRF